MTAIDAAREDLVQHRVLERYGADEPTKREELIEELIARVNDADMLVEAMLIHQETLDADRQQAVTAAAYWQAKAFDWRERAIEAEQQLPARDRLRVVRPDGA